MSRKAWLIIAGTVAVLAALVVAGLTVPVTLSEPPEEAVVYVDAEGRIVPPYVAEEDLAAFFTYQPMSYGEAVAAGHEPRDPAEIRVEAQSAFDALALRLAGAEPYLQWAGTEERLSYYD